MAGNIHAKIRAIVIRSFAVGAVLAAYAVGNIGTQIGTAVGVSALALTTSAVPARAGWGRGWGWRRRGWYGWGWRRGGWGRCPWGEWC
jgi:hypothetical protein